MSAVEKMETPKWDVALAALAQEAYDKKATGLKLIDFKRLASDYAIRLDDIMVTIFQLTIHGEWEYHDRDGEPQAIEQETLDNLYVNRRLTEMDLQDFTGSWKPVG